MITPASDRALLISFGETISQEHQQKVQSLVHALKRHKNLHLQEIQPAYASVLLTFDLLRTDHATLTRKLQPILTNLETPSTQPPPKPRTIEIPVCYDPTLAPDLPAVADHARLTTAQTIDLHASADYTVCFFGFMPGFSYWSGLPAQLATPRLTSPRLAVPAGSVAIGNAQTGIYPLTTPGGWRIIGRTPLTIFDPNRQPMCVLELGDHIRLKPISLNEFKTMGGT